MNCYSADKLSQELNEQSWLLQTANDIPVQMNGFDCGVFTCKYAECIVRQIKMSFCQTDMPGYRRKMVESIKNQTLII